MFLIPSIFLSEIFKDLSEKKLELELKKYACKFVTFPGFSRQKS